LFRVFAQIGALGIGSLQLDGECRDVRSWALESARWVALGFSSKHTFCKIKFLGSLTVD